MTITQPVRPGMSTFGWLLIAGLPAMLLPVQTMPLTAQAPVTRTTPDPAASVAVTLRTAMGDIELELYPDRAPVTVGNFLAYVDAGHFDGGGFYRVVRFDNDNGDPKIEVIQGGASPAGRGAFPPIAHESTEETGLLHRDGTISMARGGVGTATSEFFICVGDQPGLDHGAARNADLQGFAAFGLVTSGMDVVRAINRIRATTTGDTGYTGGQMLDEPVRIVEAVRR